MNRGDGLVTLTHCVQGFALVAATTVENQLLGWEYFLPGPHSDVRGHLQKHMGLAGKTSFDQRCQLGNLSGFRLGSFQLPQLMLKCVEHPLLLGGALLEVGDMHFNLLGADTVAPQEAAVCEIGSVTLSELDKPMVLDIAGDGLN